MDDKPIIMEELLQQMKQSSDASNAKIQKEEYEHLIKERALIAEILKDPKSFAAEGKADKFENWLAQEYLNSSNETEFAANVTRVISELRPKGEGQLKITEAGYREVAQTAREFYKEIDAFFKSNKVTSRDIEIISDKFDEKMNKVNKGIDEIVRETKEQIRNGPVLMYLIESIKSFLGLETIVDKVKENRLKTLQASKIDVIQDIKDNALTEKFKEEKMETKYKSFVEKIEAERNAKSQNEGMQKQ